MDYDSNQAAQYEHIREEGKPSQESVLLVKDDREENQNNYRYSWSLKATRTSTDEEGVEHITSEKMAFELDGNCPSFVEESLEKNIKSRRDAFVKNIPRQVVQKCKRLGKDGKGRDFAKLIRKNMNVKANEGCYVDMGILYGGWVHENAIIWWPEPVSLDKIKIDAFLTDFFTQLKKDGVSEVKYAFDQLSDIFKIINHEAGANTDTISPIYVDNYLVQGTQQNFLEYMTSFGLESGVTSSLSFGGALAGATEMTLPENGADCADALAGFMKQANIQSVDFDIEGSGAVAASSDPNNLAFYEALKAQVNAEGGKCTVAVAGDITIFPEAFFTDFDSYFDSISLMLYSNTQYYIDATGSLYTWSLDKWIEAVNNDPSKISIGFYDSIAYENPSSSAGEQYEVTGLTRGQAAASIYLQVCKDLGKTVNDFAPAFWWTDNPVVISSDVVLEDFYEYIGGHVLKKLPRPLPPRKRPLPPHPLPPKKGWPPRIL